MRLVVVALGLSGVLAFAAILERRFIVPNTSTRQPFLSICQTTGFND